MSVKSAGGLRAEYPCQALPAPLFLALLSSKPEGGGGESETDEAHSCARPTPSYLAVSVRCEESSLPMPGARRNARATPYVQTGRKSSIVLLIDYREVLPGKSSNCGCTVESLAGYRGNH